MKKTVTSLFTSAFVISALSAQVTYNFDLGQDDFNSNFASTQAGEFATAGIPGWVATGGVGDSGRINTGGNLNTAVWRIDSDFSTTGATDTVSVFFQTRADGGSTSTAFDANRLGIGWTTDTSGSLGGGNYFSGALTNGSGNIQLGFRTRSDTGTPSRTSTVAGGGAISSITITESNWYKMSVTLTKTGTDDTFSYAVTLEDYGLTGTATPTIVDSVAGTFTNPELYADSTLNAAFQGFSQGNGGNGIRAFDNFTAVPEPSSYAFLAGLVSIAGVALRRRRR